LAQQVWLADEEDHQHHGHHQAAQGEAVAPADVLADVQAFGVAKELSRRGGGGQTAFLRWWSGV
jgi:hypothetical protein